MNYKLEALPCRYLQWLIEDQDCDDTRFHTTYALLLSKSALDANEKEHAIPNSEGVNQKEMSTSDRGNNSIFDTHVRERLQIFLQSSDLYDPDEVLDLVEGSELWLEKVSKKFRLFIEIIAYESLLVNSLNHLVLLVICGPCVLDGFIPGYSLQEAWSRNISASNSCLVS